MTRYNAAAIGCLLALTLAMSSAAVAAPGDLDTYAPWVPTVGSGEFTTREPAEGEIVIDKVPFVIDKPGKYILTADLKADASAIVLQSADVIIDLNGHTLTYGAGVKETTNPRGIMTYNSRQKGNIGHAGVLCPSRPDATDDATGFGWNRRYRNVVVRNGKIADGDGKGLAYSNGLDLEGTDGTVVENVVVEVDAPDTFGLLTGANAKVQRVTVIHNGTRVTNRHQQVADISIGPGSEVSYCKLEGGPQAGIKARSDSDIHHNLIRQRATVTNCYGVQGYGQANIKVHDNIIAPYNGRGIHISEKSKGWEVYDNYVEVRETKNREYNRMQTHGIKFEGTTGSTLRNNAVLSVSSDGGEPTALNIDVSPDSNNHIINNTFIALTINKQGAYAFYPVGADAKGTEIRDNVFYTNNIFVYNSPDRGVNTTFRECTFRKIDPADDTLFYMCRNYKKKGTTNDRFVDCLFGPGVDPRTYYVPGKGSDWRSPADYAVAWTLKMKVTNAAQPAARAAVVVTDKDGKQVAETKTDDKGEAAVELDEFHVVFDAENVKTTVEEGAPYTVTVTAGDRTSTFKVTPKAPMSATVELLTPGVVPVVSLPRVIAPEVPVPFWRYRVQRAQKDRIAGKVGVRFDAATDN